MILGKSQRRHGRIRNQPLVYMAFLLLSVLSNAEAQKPLPKDTPNVTRIDTTAPVPPGQQLKEIKRKKEGQLSDTTGNEPEKSRLVDTTRQNKYGDLLNDDDSLNRKYPLWVPLFETGCINGAVWSV